MPARIDIPNLDDLIKQYVSGKSLLALSKETGYPRTVLILRLRERNIPVRGSSEANVVSMRQMTPQQRLRRTKKAHAAARGRKHSLSEKVARAITRQERTTCVFRGERVAAAILAAEGFSVQQQLAVGPYNLDIGLKESRVAIEVVHLSAYDFATTNSAKRLEYLLNKGWFVIFVIATGTGRKRGIQWKLVRQDLLSWTKFAREDKSVRRHYVVIWGKGKPPPRSKYDFGRNPLVTDAHRRIKTTFD